VIEADYGGRQASELMESARRETEQRDEPSTDPEKYEIGKTGESARSRRRGRRVQKMRQRLGEMLSKERRSHGLSRYD
jgi:hypothetical protein